MKDLELVIGRCRECNLSGKRKNIVVGTGDKEADILILMDSISKEEDDNGVLLGDIQGKSLKLFFKYSKLEDVKCYFTTLTKCSSRGGIISENSIDSCFEYLIGQIALIKPKYIITVGELATKKLLFLSNIKEVKKVDFKNMICNEYGYKGDIVIVPIYDKFYLLKNATDDEKWKVIKKFEEIREKLKNRI